MAGVWPWMERRRLACGDHLGKLVVEVGDEGARRGHPALCGPRWMQGGQGLAGRTGFHPSLNTETLAMASGRGRGRQGPAASSEGGVVSDLADDGQHQTGRSGHKFPLYYSCQGKTRPRRSERLGTGSGKKTPCLEWPWALEAGQERP